MTGPDEPTYADVLRSNEEARRLAEEAVEGDDDRVRAIAVREARRAALGIARRSALILLVVAWLVPLLVSVLVWQSAQSAGNLAASASRDAKVALQRLDQANSVLQSRGQPPVQAPPAAPDDPSQVEAAAITAQVLASLPATPTAEQVANLLRGAVVGQLQGPTIDELGRLAAEYFAGLPAPPGPTAEQVRAAVAAEYAANPPPPGEPGAQGEKGDPGDPGQPGAAGQDGRSIVSGPTPVRGDDGRCVWRTTYDRAPLVEESPASEAACPASAAPPVTSEPPTTTPPP